MARVYVSLGTNIDRERNLLEALAAMRERFGPLDISRVFESEAVGFNGEAFYNLVAGLDTEESPGEVAAALHQIEDQHGRTREGPRFSSRTLDLDILLYDQVVSEQPQLPRDEILHNAYVLQPLAEIAGDLVHPVTGCSIARHWEDFDHTTQRLWPVDVPGLD